MGEAADLADAQRFAAIVQLLHEASAPAKQETAVEARYRRRRKRQVSYADGEELAIEWYVEEDAPEIVVQGLPDDDRAYVSGVRRGWALLSVNGSSSYLGAADPARCHFVKSLRPTVTLEF